MTDRPDHGTPRTEDLSGGEGATRESGATTLSSAPTRHTVRSRDGTEIAFFRSGTGPPLVAVHGATTDHTTWNWVLPWLEPHVSVVTIDRRGRGDSGDHPDWDIEREFEDVAAVVDTLAAETGSGVDLMGHSFGASVALGAATVTRNVRRLVLYEADSSFEQDAYPSGVVERIARLVQEGKREQALETLFREIVHMSEEAFAAYRQLPIWPVRIATVHTVLRELAVPFAETALAPERARTVTATTLLLAGSESPPFIEQAAAALAAALPNVRVSELEGQAHTAIYDAPEMFAERVLAFLKAGDR
jgi:pimeloyl-ACP methyl ester carboxylesterase